MVTKNKESAVIFLLFTIFHFRSLGQNFPGDDWTYERDLKEWNSKKLNELRTYITDSTRLTGFLLIHKGKIVFEYGDIVENSYIASCRKSILALLYGKYVASGEITLNKSLRELKIDDIQGLSDDEKEATVGDIISARSAVFHPASNLGDYLEYAPKRGMYKHGSYWLYSNWDFNVAGYIFERETGKSIYNEIDRVLANPLSMQDWNWSLQKKDGDTRRSLYQAYPMYFSTRDMARIGLLVLNNGRWKDKQIIDSSWVKEMLKPRTNYTEVNESIPVYRGTNYSFGYGYMWWLWQNTDDVRLKGGYSAMGAWGQSISVFPNADVVVAYKTKSDYGRETDFLARHKVLSLAVQALN